MKSINFLLRMTVIIGLLLGALVLFPATPAYANTLTVTNTNDSGAGSLRKAIADAVDGDIIDASGINGMITLTSELSIDKSILIVGPGSGALTISGNNAVRVFWINSGKTVGIVGLTVSNGHVVDQHGAGINNFGSLSLYDVNVTNNEVVESSSPYLRGGGIHSYDGTSLTVTNSTISGNTAVQNGGGIHIGFNAAVALENVTIDNNHLSDSNSLGGGITIRDGSTAILNNVTISNNSAISGGGGLFSDASFTLTNSLIASNSTTGSTFGGTGGGLYLTGASQTFTLSNVTISGNSVENGTNTAQGGGIVLTSQAILNLNNVTIAGNTSQGDGSGIYAANLTTVNIGNTIIGNNTASSSASDDCAGPLNSLGNNLVEVTYGCTLGGNTTGNITGTDPLLKPLANNGGSTMTHALQYDSPAVDSANDATCESNDQRGVSRPFGSHCDMGSYEWNNQAPTDISLSASSVTENLPAGTTVGTLSTDDPDTGDAHTYSFCGGVDDASFSISVDALQTAESFDYETKNSYDICIRTDDGQGHTFDKAFAVAVIDELPSTTTVLSNASQDGWVLESTETSGTGGTKNNTATTFNLGDDAANKQYRTILSFDTSSLPEDAVITKVTLKVKRNGVSGGGNPVSIFKGFMVDIKKGSFGTSAFALGDFKVNANKILGPFSLAPSSGWYTLNLTPGRNQINKTGLTQIRLRFKLDDNNNSVANILKLYSGNAGAANRPQLIVEYYVP